MKSFDRDKEYISEEKVQEDYLRIAVEAAEVASQTKSEFINRISHDIRTPLNTIIGMTELAAADIDNKKYVQDCLKKISLSGNHLLKLINEILDINKIESGILKLKEGRANLNDITDDILTIINPQVHAKNHILKVKIHNLVHEDIIGDSMRIKEVLMNFLSNAVKYTNDGGKIVMEITEKESHIKNKACYEFIFRDNGIGMEEEFVKHIFDPFSRAENAEHRPVEGTGLGMAIARSIVQMMDGDIKVNSILGQGSEFIVTMHLKYCEKSEEEFQKTVAATEEIRQPQKPDFSGCRVLIVEDNDLNLEIASEIIRTTGTDVETAGNGIDAVKKLESMPEDYFDLIFMDIRMPKMDGYKAANVIRNSSRKYLKEIPIIAMTANAFADDIARSRAAGMNDHIVKPLKMNLIFQTMEKWLSNKVIDEYRKIVI